MSAVSEPSAQSEPARPRRAWLAALLTLLTPGLGHLYAGQPRRALTIFALWTIWVLVAVWWRTGAFPRFWMTVLLFGVWLIGTVYVIADAIRVAIRAREFRPARTNRWYVYVAFWLTGIVVGLVPYSLAKAYAPSGWFDIPSSSMEPTLLKGDRFLVDTGYYRSHEPNQGDVAIYTLTSNPVTIYVKRIVAVAGDRIAIRNGTVVVNGQPVSEPYIRVLDPRAPYNNTAEITVPAGLVFTLGDNRNISVDSRVQNHGMIPVGNLRGRVTEIGFSSDFGRLGLWVGTPR